MAAVNQVGGGAIQGAPVHVKLRTKIMNWLSPVQTQKQPRFIAQLQGVPRIQGQLLQLLGFTRFKVNSQCSPAQPGSAEMIGERIESFHNRCQEMDFDGQETQVACQNWVQNFSLQEKS